VTVTGEGLQPAGTACIEKAIRAQLEGVSAPPGGKPLTLEGPFERDPNSMVRMGLNEASDVQGTIRLAVPQWCSCFESIRAQAPPEFAGTVTLTRADATPKVADGGQLSKGVGAALQPSDPSGAQVASCVNQKIEGLPLKSTSAELQVPVQVLLVNSSGSTTIPESASAVMQFSQLD